MKKKKEKKLRNENKSELKIKRQVFKLDHITLN